MSEELDEATTKLVTDLERQLIEIERQVIEQYGDTPENRIAALRAGVCGLVVALMKLDEDRMGREVRMFKEATERLRAKREGT